MKKMNRRFAAGIAAATLTFGLVACSEAEDAATTATDTAGSAMNEAGDAAGSAAADASAAVDSAVNGSGESEDADASAEPSEGADAEGSEAESTEGAGEGSEGAEGAGDGETTTINTPAGDFEVPAGFASAVEGKVAEWGDIVNIDTTDMGSLAEYANGDMLAWSEQTQDVPVVGKIAETWKNEGGLNSDLGLPTAAEEVLTEGTGWVQEFANGSIEWLQGASGQFEAKINK